MINIGNLSKLLKKLLKAVESRLGLVILIIFVIMLLCASWIFYNFVYKPISTPPQSSFEKVVIKKIIFDRIINRIELRGENISNSMEKEYRDIFK